MSDAGYIRIQNPKYDEESFRRDNQGEMTKAGTINLGNGRKGRMGLLKGSGSPEIAYFIFDQTRWNQEEAQEWVEKSKFEEKACFDCVEFFDDGDIWVKGVVTEINKKFEPDGREIFALDIPEDLDIPVRDFHTKGFGKILGTTRKEWIDVNDNVVKFKWLVTNSDAKSLLRSSKNPRKIFKYSPELSDPVRIGHKRAGWLSGIAATDRPAFPGAETTEVLFETLNEDDREYFEKKIDRSTSNNDKEEFSMAGETENMELRLQIKDLERERDSALEKFESVSNEKAQMKQDFEQEKENFETQISEVTQERDDYKEKFEQKEKDYNDLDKDNKSLLEKVEKFENKFRQDDVDEVFELGQKAKLEGYSAENEEAMKKELFELSDDRLDEKKQMLTIMVSRTPKKQGASGVGRTGQENFEQGQGKSTKSVFTGMF